ncbi:2-amino-4-hydroxy-6-hydroxymethyldihydropteridine diphosphokinase protein [Salinisphaera shabanensis E1L3A]|jgi:2-amino-4-hydroxy-6-hydroxymethyldihydropteridine diphosphokinase|uniref:2-amino-4-hydroxy-6-hydroxymethyldihydropteridine diphosphokinase n=1 Tax=Salinisphaera shabanensis E1L3A TaxID=1033802 RepID=U2E1C7_9GAMM|nr:2-amino-4-hydroxy-6-hydroxymethyldihydropteridine diphosphokinase [Salinisphaera shabanensis]ERJ17721.1 2-amino-4-hydroxy-6-hydroxymethyldihydropteridine diphosphokinase protein [Salinisphaera shabanensis E1L3A]
MTLAVVGIGSNVSPHAHIALALDVLEQSFGTLWRSSVYRCPPVGMRGADFLNLVAAFDTAACLADICVQLRDIEAACGRDRAHTHTPPCIDIDLLLFGDVVRESDPVLPRADILDQAFVLGPLAEIMPQARHPVCGTCYADLWGQMAAQSSTLEPVQLQTDAPLSP